MKNAWKFALLVGIASLCAGFVYSFLIAGNPYQDPTPELLEKYNRNSETGELLLEIGFGLTVFAIVLFISNRLFQKPQ
ncbi:hypothetical protein HUK80_10675 [Flavobacterium sp. MAH-1]|uniref:Uncharacterized protein n=1 Tax=Flavobacterium agri TaxID=2743471 RepID=A0A7Y9C5K2_9FLAO|nr:hypothetical protein [Flavobacterium agri]NUY81362.1 hypothetical protein [Flavobacterium agri]NYA71386.1 hypothetical protein [Flavobacterium agri]